MLLQIFAACPAPAPPARITALPMGAKRLPRSPAKSASAQPTMKVSVAGSAAGHAAGDRRVGEAEARARGRLGGHVAGGLDVDGRAVDQERALGGVGKHRLVDRPPAHARRPAAW